MTSLFDECSTPPAGPETPPVETPPAVVIPRVDRDEIRRLLRETPRLPIEGNPHQRERASADPIGLMGLPTRRELLNNVVVDLCYRLACSYRWLPGKRLAMELRLQDTRALRLIVAYAHVHHRIRAIVGVPGSGYAWGPNDPDTYAVMAAHARRMGRCHFYNAALYGKGTPAVEAAQMVLDFVGQDQPHGETPDELAAMIQAEGVRIEHVLSAIIDRLSETDEGRRALRVVGDQHHSVLIPQATLDQAEQSLAAALAALRTARRAG